jgi:NAD+ diphosphatase
MRPPEELAGAPLYFTVDGTRLLAVPGEGVVRLAAQHQPAPGEATPDNVPEPAPGARHMLGSLGERPCIAIDATGLPAPAGHEWIDLRTLYGSIDDELWSIAARAVQIVEWDRTHRFCGRCGTLTQPDPRERMRNCPRCGLASYPRVSPAIITLVTRGENDDEALLAWSRRRRTPHYSTLAGFVEPGETLEEALHREVREETGVEVTDIRYFGSQSWPFPHQLMVGYRARYAGGEIVVQDQELRDARWFSPAEVETVTASRGSFSIAGRLIDGWIAEQAARVADRAAV